ncbi:MAG: protein kinase, partial [Planctomycetota bacterium]|nr:protein kinase [Planctomycetota bacterium]
MPIEFLCPNVDCGKKLSVADEKGGKKVKCPKCKGVLRVPLQSGDTAETLAASGQKREEHTALEELQPILVETGKSAHMAINVEDEIARGGMGKVVQWRHKGLSRQIAAKVMLPNIAKSRQHRLRFLEEAQVTGQLEHPNIVPIHDLGEDPEGNLFFTMKMVQGRSLGQIIKEMVKGSGVMGDGKEADGSSINHLLNIFLKACDGMAFAHSRGVVHRDLKPDNIMVGDYGEVLVMDWGLAKDLGEAEGAEEETSDNQLTDSQMAQLDSGLTQTGQVMGTVAYMPPEQAGGQGGRVDARSDVYSLGAILYELLTLRPPFEGVDTQRILGEVRKGRLISPSERAPEATIPRELEGVVL